MINKPNIKIKFENEDLKVLALTGTKGDILLTIKYHTSIIEYQARQGDLQRMGYEG